MSADDDGVPVSEESHYYSKRKGFLATFFSII